MHYTTLKSGAKIKCLFKEYKVKVILISGKKQHGKNEVGEIMRNYFYEQYTITENKTKQASMFAFADELKLVCSNIFWRLTQEHLWGDKKENVIEGYNKTTRQILQDIGIYVRSVDENYWVDRVKQKVLLADEAGCGYAIVTDCRFPNETDWRREVEDKDNPINAVIMVRVDRPSAKSDDKHISETLLDNYVFHHLIKNDGSIEDLKNKTEEVCKTILEQ